MPDILITTSSFASNDPGLIDDIKAHGLDIRLNPYGRKLTEEEVNKLIAQYQPVGMIAGVEPLTGNVLEKAENLKVISRCGIGLDSVDLDKAGQLGIAVTNTPDAPTMPVAELTLGMILSLLRRIHISDSSIRKGGWERPMGTLLSGKTIGLIGLGRIGSYLAALLAPFGCRILGYDIAKINDKNCQSVSLEILLKDADIVSLHLPYSPEKHHFINADSIKNMKKGAILINASRGGLVDETAVYEALISKHLGGAGFDCFEEEPYQGPMKNFDNVILTGHIGSYAREGRKMMERQSVENLIGALRDRGILK